MSNTDKDRPAWVKIASPDKPAVVEQHLDGWRVRCESLGGNTPCTIDEPVRAGTLHRARCYRETVEPERRHRCHSTREDRRILGWKPERHERRGRTRELVRAAHADESFESGDTLVAELADGLSPASANFRGPFSGGYWD